MLNLKSYNPVPGDYVLVYFKPLEKQIPVFILVWLNVLTRRLVNARQNFQKSAKLIILLGNPRLFSRKTMNTFNEDDESFPESDIIKILPLSYVTGTTSRQKKFVFPINLNRWNVY